MREWERGEEIRVSGSFEKGTKRGGEGRGSLYSVHLQWSTAGVLRPNSRWPTASFSLQPVRGSLDPQQHIRGGRKRIERGVKRDGIERDKESSLLSLSGCGEINEREGKMGQGFNGIGLGNLDLSPPNLILCRIITNYQHTPLYSSYNLILKPS